MRLSFNGTYSITRRFGVVDAAYSRYPGSKHPGTDYGVPANTPLVAGISGTVQVFLSTAKIGRGNEIWIISGTYSRRVCHLNRVDVHTGQHVTEGQPIGLSGFTGYVLDAQGKVGTPGGAHLHDELLVNGRYVDVDKFLKEEDMPLTPGQLDRLIKGILGREPTKEELNNPAYLKSAGLAIETFWNNGGEIRFKAAKQPDNAQAKLDAIKKLLS